MLAEIARRPLKSRQTAWASALAQNLPGIGISPNAISVASAIFSLFAAVALYLSSECEGAARMNLLLLAIAGMQFRLLCNLLDGMVAIEGGRKTKSGEIFNDLPDRIADCVIFIGAGCVARTLPFGIELGFLAAALSILTAYVRVLGGACGLKQSFIGPMAKQQRMAVMSAACVLAIFETKFVRTGAVFFAALIGINMGCLVTAWRRTAHIVRELESR